MWRLSALLDEQLLRAVELLFDDPEAGAELDGLSHHRHGGRLGAEKSLDFGPEAARLQPQHQGELKGRDEVGINGQLGHALAGGPLLHAQVDEGPPQATGLAGGQVQQLLPDVLQELVGDEQFGAAQSAVRVFGLFQASCDQVHHLLEDSLLHRVVEEVFTAGRQLAAHV